MIQSPDASAGILDAISPHLTADDDAELWDAVIQGVYEDADYLCRYNREQRPIVTRIGCCSHWLRPHQTRWTADGGFAWPAGYRTSAYVPELDWHLTLVSAGGSWHPATSSEPGSLCFRIAVPARTRRHRQAAINTIWLPGSPPQPDVKLIQLYGFRRHGSRWECTATHGGEDAYDLAAEFGCL